MRNSGSASRSRSVSPSASSSHASVTAVGRPAATSCAKVGPDSTATGLVGQTSRATWWSISPLPSSIPFEHRISGMSGHGERDSTARICCAGVTTSHASQLDSSEKLLVARIAGLSFCPRR